MVLTFYYIITKECIGSVAYQKLHKHLNMLQSIPDDYIKGVLNWRTDIPEKKRRIEIKTLLAERYELVDEYYKISDDVKNVEALRRGANQLMRDVAPERTTTRALGAER